MLRALMWLNLYGHQAVQYKLKKGIKSLKKIAFLPLLSLRPTAWRPYRLSQINALCINLSYLPKDQSLKLLRKNIENWRSWKMTFCFVFCFFVFCYWVFQKKIFWFILNENHHGFHMHNGWFLQNLEKGFIWTNMHTTVNLITFFVLIGKMIWTFF